MRNIFLKYSIFLLGLLFPVGMTAAYGVNQVRIDSLENILYNSLSHNLSPVDKIDICLSLSELYSKSSHDKQAEYGARALIIAEELGDDRNITRALNQLSDAYFQSGNYHKSIEYSTRLYNIYHTGSRELEAADALKLIAENHFNLSNYLDSKNYFERALDIYKKNQYFEGIAMALSGQARIHSHWGEYDEALNKYQDALRFWEDIENQEGIASMYTGIGQIYEDLDNLDMAFDYFKKSLTIYQDLGNTREIVQLTLNIGDIYLRRQIFEKALEYFFKAEELGKELNNKRLKANMLSNIGEAYNMKGDYLKALSYQEQSLALKEEIGDKKLLSISYTELGLIYFNVEDYRKALFFMQKGLDIAHEINFRYQINKCNYYLTNIYERTGNHKKALKTYKEYISGREAVNSEEKQQMIADMQAKYEVEKKEKENERLLRADDRNSAQIRLQQLIIGFVLFILLGSFVLSIIMHKRYQQNRGLNIQLSLKNKEIEEQQRNVESLNAELKEANATKDKFFSIVAHDLKNPFNSLLVLSKLLLDDYDTFTHEERKQFIQQIKSSAENTYSLLQNLLSWASTQSGKAVIIKEEIDIAKLSQEAIILLKPIAKNKKITIESLIGDNTRAWADKNMVSTVLLNLVSNAVKFTPHRGRIEVKAIERNNHVEVEIHDTGIGISEENIKKLFKPDVKFHTVGTDKEKGTGLGLLLCKEFVEKNDGSIWVESSEGKGSIFYFSLPKSSPLLN